MKLRDFYEEMKDIFNGTVRIYDSGYTKIHQGDIQTLEILSDNILYTKIDKVYVNYYGILCIVLCSSENKQENTIDEFENKLSEMGIVLRNEDGSYRSVLDVFLDISKIWSKTKGGI